MEASISGSSSPTHPKWRKVVYGGRQPGFGDNHTDESFLEEMIMNANVVRRDLLKVVLDAVSILQYLCVVALVVLPTFFILLLTADMIPFNLLLNYLLKNTFFITALYMFSPIYHTLTRSISSNSIWALTASLLILHLFLHNYSGSTVKAPGALDNPTLTSNISLNASIVASLLISSRLPSRLHVFAIVFFSLQVFLFAPVVTYCVKKYSFKLHICFSLQLLVLTLIFTYQLHKLLFIVLLGIFGFVNLVCPYWLIKIQEYKFEINGPWDEAKLCFNITE
ncbi:unnamed protein product [Withania somnifera]